MGFLADGKAKFRYRSLVIEAVMIEPRMALFRSME